MGVSDPYYCHAHSLCGGQKGIISKESLFLLRGDCETHSGWAGGVFAYNRQTPKHVLIHAQIHHDNLHHVL